MLKKTCLLIVLIIITIFGISCGNGDVSNATKLSFKSASSYNALKPLDGQIVQINGYMATSSPVDGSFMFLMNLPYQNCPFCVANTSMLSNTMEVYPRKNKPFVYTNQAIKIVGKLVVSPNENEHFTDEYGYEFNFKIVDADMKILKDSDLSQDIKIWQKIAQTDIIKDIYSMYDYLNFTVFWPTYYSNSYTDENGVFHRGYYLYAEDALYLITNKSGQYHYGYEKGYFEDIISRIEKIDAKTFASLISNVKKAYNLANSAYADLSNNKFSYKEEYVERFGGVDRVYSLDNKDRLEAKYADIYKEFLDWIASWEM